MFDHTDQRLSEWVSGILADTKISLEPPNPTASAPSISLYLLDIGHSPAQLSSRAARPQVLLRYLVTPQAPDQSTAHKLMGNLVKAVLSQTEFEFEFAPLPLELWQCFGVRPSPAFMIMVPVSLQQDLPETPRVKLPPKLRTGPVDSLKGRVLGPGNIPLGYAQVELTSLQRSTATDDKGYFSFSGIEPGVKTREFRIITKHQELLVTLAMPAEAPLIIHFDHLES